MFPRWVDIPQGVVILCLNGYVCAHHGIVLGVKVTRGMMLALLGVAIQVGVPTGMQGCWRWRVRRGGVVCLFEGSELIHANSFYDILLLEELGLPSDGDAFWRGLIVQNGNAMLIVCIQVVREDGNGFPVGGPRARVLVVPQLPLGYEAAEGVDAVLCPIEEVQETFRDYRGALW